MTTALKIDFVSDISCPWCIIGLKGLEEGLARAKDAIRANIAFQPFELNPDMPPEGQNIGEYVAQKYGSTPEQSAAARAMVCQRAADLGFVMEMTGETRLYNTFDAHRLLHWAGIEGRQRGLKVALFEAYFTDGGDPSDFDILVGAAVKAGLDEAQALDVLSTGRYADEVRYAERLWRSRGINAVPAVVINDKYLISGGQPPDAFEKALRDIAAEATPAA